MNAPTQGAMCGHVMFMWLLAVHVVVSVSGHVEGGGMYAARPHILASCPALNPVESHTYPMHTPSPTLVPVCPRPPPPPVPLLLLPMAWLAPEGREAIPVCPSAQPLPASHSLELRGRVPSYLNPVVYDLTHQGDVMVGGDQELQELRLFDMSCMHFGTYLAHVLA